MSVTGLAIALAFLFCCAGACIGPLVPERRIPLLLAWAGSLAALAALCASALVLRSGVQFHAHLWTVPSIATLSVSLDKLSAFFLLIATIVILASSAFSAGYMKRYLGRYSLTAFKRLVSAAVRVDCVDPGCCRRSRISDRLGTHVPGQLHAGEFRAPTQSDRSGRLSDVGNGRSWFSCRRGDAAVSSSARRVA